MKWIWKTILFNFYILFILSGILRFFMFLDLMINSCYFDCLSILLEGSTCKYFFFNYKVLDLIMEIFFINLLLQETFLNVSSKKNLPQTGCCIFWARPFTVAPSHAFFSINKYVTQVLFDHCALADRKWSNLLHVRNKHVSALCFFEKG